MQPPAGTLLPVAKLGPTRGRQEREDVTGRRVAIPSRWILSGGAALYRQMTNGRGRPVLLGTSDARILEQDNGAGH